MVGDMLPFLYNLVEDNSFREAFASAGISFLALFMAPNRLVPFFSVLWRAKVM
jgi:hypothetical protein